MVAGTFAPLWQVTHVTTRRPPKLVLLIVLTMTIICRAICFLGLSLAYSAHPPPPSPRWQYVQFTARAFEMNPMEPMNSSAGTPLRTWMLVNTSSARTGRAAAGVGAA